MTTITRRSKLASYAVAGVLGLLTVGAVVSAPAVRTVQAQSQAKQLTEQADGLTRVATAKRAGHVPAGIPTDKAMPAPTARA